MRSSKAGPLDFDAERSAGWTERTSYVSARMVIESSSRGAKRRGDPGVV